MPENQNSPKETLESLTKSQQELEIKKSLLLEQQLSSNSAEDILKAKAFLEANKKNTGDLKSYLYFPNKEGHDSNGYKQPTKSLSFDILRNMGKTPVINSIVSTRVDQVKRFNTFQTDLQKEGWTITKKLGRFDKSEDYELTDKDKAVIDKIATFIEDSGENDEWDLVDDFQEFLDKIVRDSLELDQAGFECERNRSWDLVAYQAIDGATIRLLETINEKDEEAQQKFQDVKGFYPRYAQVWNNNIITNKEGEKVIFYPWQLGYITRNKTSSIKNNGYGVSELEILIEIITWMLWGMQYNGNFFKQGSAPPGFFSIEGSASQSAVDMFRQTWRNQMSGVGAAHKIPFFQGKDKINWTPMGSTNKDMEFSNWNDFLMIIACSVYKIDPSELGYNLQKSSNIFGQDGQKERLDHSKDKGLKPLLVVLQKAINKYIVSQLDTSYEFRFTGIDLEDEKQKAELNKMLLESGQTSMEDVFEQVNGRPFNPKKDTLLNSVYWQAQQAKQFGGEESNAAVDEMTGEQDEGVSNPFDEYSKGEESNPIAGKALDYLRNNTW